MNSFFSSRLLVIAASWSLAFGLVFLPVSTSQADESSGQQTENLIIVTFDGLRPLEVFQGADSRLLNRSYGGVKNVAAINARYGDDDPEVRREKLLPFLWGTIAREGQLFGDASQDCPGVVANKYRFSAPGYSEMFSGFPDDKIKSNEKTVNPNPTVLGWLNSLPRFKGRVSAFTSWDVFPFILSARRDGLMVNACWDGAYGPAGTEKTQLLADVSSNLPRYFPALRYDVFTFHAALEHMKKEKPRVLYLSIGETDDWGHSGRYDLVLDAAYQGDQFIRRLWETAQSIPQYAGKTSLLITTDHGRGDSPSDWKDHGESIEGAESIWIAAMGPDTPALGNRQDQSVTLSQVAATAAMLLGEDYVEAVPQAAAPLPGITAEVVTLHEDGSR